MLSGRSCENKTTKTEIERCHFAPKSPVSVAFVLPLDGILAHHKVNPPPPSPSIKFAGTHLQHLGQERHCESKDREVSCLAKNTSQCPQPGLEPKHLDLKTNALTKAHHASTLKGTRLTL